MRTLNWQAALAQWAQGIVGRPFAWGETDCHALALDAIRAMYVEGDPIRDGWPEWRSLGDAARLYASGWSPVDALERRGFGAVVREGPSFARAGDLLVAPDTPFWRVGVVVPGAKVVSSRVDEAVTVLPLASMWTETQLVRLRDG